MAVKNDWIYFILTKLLAMVFVAGILWERYRCFFEKTVIRLVDISHIFLSFLCGVLFCLLVRGTDEKGIG